MSSEFDGYAAAYSELLHDPIRERFAPGSRFFAARKLILLRDVLRRRGWDSTRQRWLDFGCGQGDLLRLGKPYFHEAAGCDISAAMIESCRDLNVRKQESPYQIPFPDGAFDLVTAVCVYHHIEPTARSLLTSELSRVLRPGGIVCVIEHNPFNPLTQLIVRRSPVDIQAKLLAAHTVRHLLRRVDLRVLETDYFLYFPERLYSRLAGLEAALARAPLGGQYAVFGEKGQ